MISTLLIVALGLVGVYAFALRRRLVRWGATDAEVTGSYPGTGIIPGAGEKRGMTMAVTIDGPPSAVWPWPAQMGVDRAMWYTWDYWRLWGLRSADRIHPEWQDISVGHRMLATPNGSTWWEVAALEPERFLGLRMSVDLRGRPFDPNRTRLVVSGYGAFRPKWLQDIVRFMLLEPTTWIMQMPAMSPTR